MTQSGGRGTLRGSPPSPVARNELPRRPESTAALKMPEGVALASGAPASAHDGARRRSPCNLPRRRKSGVLARLDSFHLGHVVEPCAGLYSTRCRLESSPSSQEMSAAILSPSTMTYGCGVSVSVSVSVSVAWQVWRGRRGVAGVAGVGMRHEARGTRTLHGSPFGPATVWGSPPLPWREIEASKLCAGLEWCARPSQVQSTDANLMMRRRT